MGKREKKLEIIQKYIENASGSWSAYTYGKIPSDVAKGACSSYVGVRAEEILGIIDITILGNGKKGMAFTEHKIYYDNGFLGSKGSISYEKLSECEYYPDGMLNSSYNNEALKEMLSNLMYIEKQTFTKSIDKTITDIDDGINTVADIVDKAADVIDKLSKLFGSSETK